MIINDGFSVISGEGCKVLSNSDGLYVVKSEGS